MIVKTNISQSDKNIEKKSSKQKRCKERGWVRWKAGGVLVDILEVDFSFRSSIIRCLGIVIFLHVVQKSRLNVQVSNVIFIRKIDFCKIRFDICDVGKQIFQII